ncbi:MAG: malate/lactate/ureidoglycolate dehydrogenase [Alphaproteobacteria bacterium]
MTVPVEKAWIERLVADIFVAAGCSGVEAAAIAGRLVEANLAGHDSHGVIRVPRYVKMLREGEVFPDRTMTVVSENAAMAVVDGNLGFGQTIGPQAVRLGIDKARAGGVAVVALRRAGHLGRIGDWAEMAAEAGFVSLHFVNVSGSLLVAPFGGVERRLGTNPVAIGVPLAGAPPLVLDFATSVVAEGKALVAFQGGPALPEGSLIDDDGKPTADPGAFYGAAGADTPPSARRGRGALRAMGEHKGSGLSFMCEILAGALAGSGCAASDKHHVFNGMLSVYMDVAAFDAQHAFAAEVRRFVDFFKSARPACAGGEVLVPGEIERRRRAERLARGIPLSETTRRVLADAARSVGLDEARIGAGLGL